MAGTSAGARKGWETRRANQGYTYWRRTLKEALTEQERLGRSKKLSYGERHMAQQRAGVLRYRYKQMGARWQGGWEPFARVK